MCLIRLESPQLLAEAEELVAARETAIKLSQTRRVLIAQLEEASRLEARENLQLTHRVFSSWHSLTADDRIRLVKARTVDEWRTMCRVFSAWKNSVGRSREAREREQLAGSMVQERQGDSIAWKHFSGKLARKCFASWRIWARNTGELRRHADKIREKRIKMAIFLEAAEKGKITQERNVPRELRKQKSHPLDIPIRVGDLFQEKIGVVTSKMVREKIRTIPESQKKRKEKIDKSNSTPAVVVEKDKICTEPVPKSISIIIPDATARDTAPLYVPPEPPVPPSHPKRFTTPIPLTQMEERSAVILQRKRDREERMRALEEERAAREQEEEARRAEEEETARRAEALKRQNERRAEKQREVEKVMAREKLAMQTRKASVHYERSLLKKYCLGGLAKFRAIQVRKGKKADGFHRVTVQREYFPIWIQALRLKEQIKLENAEKYYKEYRLKSALRHWIAYVRLYNDLNDLANQHFSKKAAQKSWRAWRAYTREEIRVYLRRCLMSDIFFNRLLVRRSFRAVRGFIPLMQEERQRELRLEVLREQVRQVLPDYGQN